MMTNIICKLFKMSKLEGDHAPNTENKRNKYVIGIIVKAEDKNYSDILKIIKGVLDKSQNVEEDLLMQINGE